MANQPSREAFGLETERSPFGSRGVIGAPEKSTGGNLVLRVGNEHPLGGWAQSCHVVLTPDEATDFLDRLAALGFRREPCDCDSDLVPGALAVPDEPEEWTVQRCDQCERFPGDLDAALAVAEHLGRKAWFIRHDHTTGECRITQVTREVVDGPDEGWSIAESTNPWVGEPDAGAWSSLPDGQDGAITVLPPEGLA